MAGDSDAGLGLLAQYYGDSNLTTYIGSVVVAQVGGQWSTAAPTDLVPPVKLDADNFSVRWSGQIEARFTERHQFIVNAEGGVRLWVNGTLLINQFTATQLTNATNSIDLVAGRRYDIQLEFRETSGNASLQLEWASPSVGRTTIPRSQLFASERGTLFNERWNSVSGSATVNLTTSTELNSPPVSVTTLARFETPSNSGDNFLSRQRGWLYPSETGNYQFYISGDEAAELWLSNSSSPSQKQKIAFVSSPSGSRNWTASTSQQSVLLSLVAGQSYYIEALQRENSGTDYLAVGWKKPNSSVIEIIPGDALAPLVPRVEIAAIQPTIGEVGSAPAKFTVYRSEAPTTNAITVFYRTRGTARVGVDTSVLSGSVTIPAGQSSADINVNAISDSLQEGTESLTIELVDRIGYEVGLISQRTALLTIQDIRPAPTGGVTLLSGTRLSNFDSAFGANFTEVVDSSPGAVPGVMLQVAILSQPTATYDVQLIQSNASPIAAGDLLWTEFYIRSATGSGLAQIVHEQNQAPFSKSLNQGIPLTTAWTKVQIPFVASKSFATNEGNFSFHLGSQIQTVQIAQLKLKNLGQSMDLMPTSGMILNSIGGNWGFSSTVSVSGQPFSRADQIQTLVSPPINESYRLQGLFRSSAKVRSGNTLNIEFYARSINGTQPRLQVALQRTDTFAALLDRSISLTSQWQKFTYNVVVTSDFDIDGIQLAFFAGFKPQTVLVGGVKWTNTNATSKLSDLPSLAPIVSYKGRDPFASWRDSAEARISQNRQASVTLNVVDANGVPIDGAVVHLRQTSHLFQFGTAISGSNGLLDSPATNSSASLYQSFIKRLFNSVVIENELKWPQFEDDRQSGIDTVNWSVNNDLDVRGHNLLWPSRQNMPSSIWNEYDRLLAVQGSTAAQNYLRNAIVTHITDIVSQFKGKISDWDVVNEPFANNDVMGILGNPVVLDWFGLVRQLSPETKRVLNDYEIFANNGNNSLHRSNFDNWLTLLTAQNLVDIIGEQSHFNEGNLTGIDTLGSLINSYSTQFNRPIAITELDIDSKDAQLQADYFRDYMIQAFSQPAISKIIQWGFWSESHWIPNAALYNADFSIKPNGQVYEDLVFGDWWTDTRATTRQGSMTSRVTLGNYEVDVYYLNQKVSTTILNLAGNAIKQIQLPGIVVLTKVLESNEGRTVTYPLVLNSKPTDNVTVNIAGDLRHVSIAQPSITFTPNNWNIPINVSLRLIEDYTAEGNQQTIVTHTSFSRDPNFNLRNIPSLQLKYTDGVTPSIGISSNVIALRASIGTTIGSLAAINALPTEVYSFSIAPSANASDNRFFSIVGNRLVTAASFSSQSKATFSVLIRATDRFGMSFDRFLSVNINSTPTIVGSIVVGDGTVQRSMVEQLSVEFSTAVVIDSSAFALFKRTRNASSLLTLVPVGFTTTSKVLSNGHTQVVFTFTSATRPGTRALEEGNYQLTIDGSKIRTEGTTRYFDGDSNASTLGGVLTFGANASDRFFSQFGNASIDRIVDAGDNTLFTQANNSRVGQPGFSPIFDINRDQKIDAADQSAFLRNYNKTLPFF